MKLTGTETTLALALAGVFLLLAIAAGFGVTWLLCWAGMAVLQSMGVQTIGHPWQWAVLFTVGSMILKGIFGNSK